jgi:predicted ATPase
MLRVASIIGYSLDVPFLVRVVHKLNQKKFFLSFHQGSKKGLIEWIRASLTDAVQLGFLCKKSRDVYHFAHDNVHTAFHALSDDKDVCQLHHHTGEVYFESGHDGLNMYNTAVHWNAASHNMGGRYQRQKLARINLEAAKYCHEKAAFARAVHLLRTSLALFNDNEKWESKNSELTINILEMLARMELIVGNFAACKEITESAILHIKLPEKKINFFLIGVEAQITAFDSESALESAQKALRCLGLKIPKNISFWHMALKLCKTKQVLHNKSNEEILSLPMMKDKRMSTAVRFLVLICMYRLLNNKIHHAIYSALLAIQLTITYGLSPYSANALAIYGVAEIALKNYGKGYRFGRLALRLSEMIKSKDAECATMGFTLTFLSFWKDSFHDLQHKLFRSGARGYKVGDIFYGTF